MIKSNLVKEANKPTAEWDWNSSLRWFWKSDNSRPWDTVYSKEKFTKFWDGRNCVTVKEYSR